MLKTQQKSLTGSILRKAGWNALVKSLGLVNATRFLLKIKKQLLKGKSVRDICKEIEKLETINAQKK